MSKSDSGESNGSTESSNSASNESASNEASLKNNNNKSDKTDSSPGGTIEDAPPNDKTQNSTSPNPKSPNHRRMVQATELRFQCIDGRTSVSRVAVLLCNISDRALYYKFKTDTMDLLSALPSATGHIAARGSSRVVLTWQRPKHIKKWENVGSPKLLLVTRFLDSSGVARDTTSTRLIAFLDPTSSCQSDNPPLEQLMLDALSKNNDNEMTVTKSADTDSSTQALESPANETQNPNTTLALIFLAIFIGVCLYRALHPVAVVVR
jgi:hypothetical protein